MGRAVIDKFHLLDAVTAKVSGKRPKHNILEEEEEEHPKSKRQCALPGVLEEETKEAPQEHEHAASFLAANEITFHCTDAPLPCMSFQSAPFPKRLIKLLMAQPGFETPSAVQAASWPLAVAGRDVLAIAKTGSGKTLGYLLPALARCRKEKDQSDGCPICLVMAPTRELAIQIASEAEKFGECLDCRAVAVYGGARKSSQANALWSGCEIIAATPGRLLDLLDVKGQGKNAWTNLAKCSMLVLDEADRMLDMGFEKEIRAIVWELPVPHQTLFYSATWPHAVQNIAHDLLSEPAKVTVGSGGEKLTANTSVTQRVHVLEGPIAKARKLLELLKGFGRDDRVIVFANTKIDVQWISEHCTKNGLCVDSVSSFRSQAQREAVLQRFRTGELNIVVATDVCGRGLDIDGIEHVINYDFPDPDSYIHRIGRTGRAGASGTADSFFTVDNKIHAKELIRILTDSGQVVPAELGKFTGAGVSKSFADSDDE